MATITWPCKNHGTSLADVYSPYKEIAEKLKKIPKKHFVSMFVYLLEPKVSFYKKQIYEHFHKSDPMLEAMQLEGIQSVTDYFIDYIFSEMHIV